MTAEPLLRVRGVRAVYGDTVALDDVSLDIADNEFFALLGPSGCGKTTLLRSIAGFESPVAGAIDVDGVNLLGIPPHRRPVNLMFQSYALFPHMSVEKNIAYGLEAEGVARAEVRSRVADVIEVVRLGHLAKRRPAAPRRPATSASLWPAPSSSARVCPAPRRTAVSARSPGARVELLSPTQAHAA